MMPALGRGVQNVYIGMNIASFPNVDIMLPLFISQGIILAMILAGALKYNKLTHPATFLAIAINVFCFFLEPLGRSESAEHFLRMVIKGGWYNMIKYHSNFF